MGFRISNVYTGESTKATVFKSPFSANGHYPVITLRTENLSICKTVGGRSALSCPNTSLQGVSLLLPPAGTVTAGNGVTIEDKQFMFG
jgi:hypothetical protein